MEHSSGLSPATSTKRTRLCHGAGVASGQRSRQSAPFYDGQGTDHRDAGKSASLQYLSDHPGAEEAFRARRDATGSSLTKTNYSESTMVKDSRTMPSSIEQ